MDLNFLLGNDDSEISLESANAMAVYFDIEPAIESVSGIVDGIKKKIGVVVEKLKEFVLKVKNWLKNKVYTFLKKDTFEVNAEKYALAMKLVSKVDGINVNFMTSVRYGLAASTDNDAALNKSIENMNEVGEKLKEIKESAEFAKVLADTDFKGGKTVIRTDSITDKVKKLETSLNEIEKCIGMIASMQVRENSQDAFKNIMQIQKLAMNKLLLMITLLNHVMSGTAASVE